MASLITGQTYRIREGTHAGIWRVICILPHDIVLVRLPIDGDDPAAALASFTSRKGRLTIVRLDRALVESLLEDRTMQHLDLPVDTIFTRPRADLPDHAREALDRRAAIMSEFLEPAEVLKNFLVNDTFGPLVRRAVTKHCDLVASEQEAAPANASKGSLTQRGGANPAPGKALVYEFLKRLCFYGFQESSLNPLFQFCGAPGKPKPYGPSAGRHKPGPPSGNEKFIIINGPEAAAARNIVLVDKYGIPEEKYDQIVARFEASKAPGVSDADAAKAAIEDLYVIGWEWKGGHLGPVMPPLGQYPEARQVLRLVKAQADKERLIRLSTTKGHFDRNLRGLKGTARDGVAGPGHVIAMDSTVADAHLRSAINRHWIAGRPLVYWLVDVWSTAIVGFYACFMTPAWRTAKIGLLCSFLPDEMADVLGISMDLGLDPLPSLPALFRVDRGEYLSFGARQTARALGLGCEFNPSLRADLKGSVEVINRIQKDDAYGFVPGAMDRRREEIELRPDARLSLLTLRQFIKYLEALARKINLTANRRSICPAEMIAAGIPTTPAGLWHWGYRIGIGYQSIRKKDVLITNLLPEIDRLRITPSGVKGGRYFFRSGDIKMEDWTVLARNYGTIPLKGYYVPSSVSHIWTTLPGDELRRFELVPNAPVPREASWPEASDVDALAAAKHSAAVDAALKADLGHRETIARLEKEARDALEAERAPERPLTIPEVRQRENRDINAPEESARVAADPGEVSPMHKLIEQLVFAD